MSIKWSESTMVHFLTLYRKHGCLWDSRLETYKLKEAREAALDSIVKEMNKADLTKNDVKTKIKTVRTMYKKEYVLVRKSKRLGSDRLYVPRLFWYKQADSFLNAITDRRESLSNSNISQEEDFIIDDVEVKSEVMDDTTETSENMDIASSAFSSNNDTQEEQFLNEMQEPDPLNTPKLVVQAPRCLKRKMVHDLTGAIENLDQIVDNWKSSRGECENEFDIFGKLIAVQMKQMPLFDALSCQEQIQTVLRQKRLEIIMRQQTTANSTHSIPKI